MIMNEVKSHEALKTGTTTVGIASKTGVVLASDKRATMGYLIASKDIDKIYPLSNNIAMTIAGGVGDAQTLVRWMQAEIKLYELRQGQKISVSAAATLLANILAQYKYYPFFVQLLIGGFDGKAKLFSVDMLGGITEEKIASTGSGSPIAYGVLEELWKDDAKITENARIAAKAVSAAIKRDAASGERVDVVVVDDNGYRKFSKEEVKEMLA
ncbi:archaeal proteasome endopeptidase complex subunit beta [Candidatus Micrarchaeota archaeon]|nr:archaeal proteasome endopeptidase complex subunit beta [Candidatus Micrarchaeota archaeon]